MKFAHGQDIINKDDFYELNTQIIRKNSKSNALHFNIYLDFSLQY